MARAVLGVGGNLGARRAIFECAVQLLDAAPGCRVLSRSPLYATPALGPPQPDYLNAALLVEWAGRPDSLLTLVRHVEQQLGRERRERWGPRTLDLDLLHWSEGPVHTPSLRVPHLELTKRNFALAPLLDVLPELRADYGDALSRLGTPRLASPGWPVLRSVEGGFELTGAEDEHELASLLAGAVVPRGACVVPRASLCFRIADGGTRRLFDLAAELATQGFAACGAAILGREAGCIHGVLVGAHGPQRAHPCRVELVRFSPEAGLGARGKLL